MILGIGIDIEEISNIRKMIKEQKFINMVFSHSEIEYCNQKRDPAICFAGRFCAKEAVIKALQNSYKINDIEILSDSQTKKIKVRINGKETPRIHCSISHTQKTSTAIAIYEKKKLS